MKETFLTGLGILLFSFLYGQSPIDKLNKMLDVLEKIKTASYYSISSSSAPGDTVPFSTHEFLVNMYVNPSDTFLGASFSTSPIENPNEFDLCYDGTYCVRLDWRNRRAQLDTLTKMRSRPMAPFFVNVKSLIAYAKTNIDSCVIKFQDFQDSVKVNFYFYDKIVELIGPTPFVRKSVGKVSRYELLVDKNYLPYKFIRRMPYQTSWVTCKDIKVTDYYDYDFSAVSQIPADFIIKGRELNTIKTLELEGKIAAGWKLKEVYGDSISLRELKSKVLLIQFTGIGCGPCHASIPFLKKLASDYKGKSFELISIETWSDKVAGLERYKNRNEIPYKFLMSKKELNNEYKIQAVPTFFILDEKRLIKKVSVGYKEGVTDKEIIKVINKLF